MYAILSTSLTSDLYKAFFGFHNPQLFVNLSSFILMLNLLLEKCLRVYKKKCSIRIKNLFNLQMTLIYTTQLLSRLIKVT